MTPAEYLAEFRIAFPEFAAATDTVVLTRIDLAILRTPENIWGNQTKWGVLYLTAHLMAMVPGGERMRLEDGTSTLYKKERDHMAVYIAAGPRVASRAAIPR